MREKVPAPEMSPDDTTRQQMTSVHLGEAGGGGSVPPVLVSNAGARSVHCGEPSVSSCGNKRFNSLKYKRVLRTLHGMITCNVIPNMSRINVIFLKAIRLYI